MANWKDQLEGWLVPPEASASGLDAEARDKAHRILIEASAANQAEALLHELNTRFPIRGAGAVLIPPRAYLRGRLLLELERDAEALEILLPLCEKLEQHSQWTDLAQIADEILGRTARIEAARYLAKAAEQAGPAALPEGSLTRALELFPDECRLGWLVAEEQERRGETESALALFAGCLPALIEDRALGRVEEVFLRLEDYTDPETTEILLQACVKLATLKEWKLAETYLEPLLPRIRAAGLAGTAWELFVKLLPKAPADSNLRRFMLEIAPQAIPDVDGILDLLQRSGILDPKIKVETALKHLHGLLEFAPGYRVLHQNWGVGRIRVNEGETLIIDFPGRPGHRMSLALARSALKVIPADDLRVLWTESPEKVREMLREKPADLAYLAIRELGGRATTQDLRRRLTAELIPVSRWSTWWKDARTAMDADERFDLSEGFRQTFGIRSRTSGDLDLILPRLDRRRGVRTNLGLLRRFIDQHPQHQEQAIRMYTPVLIRWLRDDHTPPDSAMAICFLLHRWGRLDPEDLGRSLHGLLSTGVEAIAFPDEADQRFLVDRAMRIRDLERPAVLFALGSKFESLRHLALEKLAENPADSEALITDLLSRPEERPSTAMASVWSIIDEGSERQPFLPSPWVAATALCRLVERTNRDPVRTQAMRLFTPNSALAVALRRQPAPEEIRSALESELRRWRESERFLFPILAFFEALGLPELAIAVRQNRTDATNRFLRAPEAVEDRFTGLFLSRAAYTRFEQERDHLARELKTTVAQAIQRAREHGDISENAEYVAAKEKQASYAKRIMDINEMLRKATLLDHVRVAEGEVGPGCRVELQVTDVATGRAEPRRIWLLGEGDQGHGPEVVSCTSAIGRALLGRHVGDAVDLVLPGGTVRAEIRSAMRELPPTTVPTPAS
jgi:transcription elongation factor GreA